MNLKFVREATVAELKARIKENLGLYRAGRFEFLSEDSANSFETSVLLEPQRLNELQVPDGEENFDASNSRVAFESFDNISPYEAADERLWVMLTHTELLEYTRLRWPIPDDDEDAVKHIRTHFFAGTQRQLERDNAASRLWWMGYLCSRASMPIDTALEVLLYRSDVRANVIERPTTAQSVPVFSAILGKLHESYSGDRKLFERKKFRSLMTFLNTVGGYYLLDAMSQAWIEHRIDEHISASSG